VSEWNLSVRLTGQGSGLSRALRDTARDARAASRDVNALHRDVDRLRDSARTRIRIRAELDAGHLRSDLRAALSTAGAGQGLAVNLRLGNAMQLRRDVESAVRWAAWGHRIEIPIGLRDPNQLRRDVSTAVRSASRNQTVRIRVEPDTSALRGLGAGRGGSGRGADFGLGSLIPLASAAVPLVAGLTANLSSLVGMFAATGGAATAFGIALAGQVQDLSEVADAEKKYQEAVRDHGQASAEAIQAQLAYQRVLATMPPETQKAAVALSRLKSTFGDWSDDMSGFTMQPLTKGFTVLEQLIPRLSPEVASFSGQMDRLMDVAGGAISTPGFDAFTDKVAALTDQQLDEFTDQVIHLLRVVSQGDADAGVVGQILAYMRENGPEAREAIEAIGDAVGNLAQGAAEAGPTMLTLVTAAARLVAALPPELVAIILQAATALKLLQLSGAGLAALAVTVGRVRTSILGLAGASAAAGGGLAGLRAAFLALGTAAKASVIVAGIALAAAAVGKLMEVGRAAPPDIDKLTTSLGKLGKSGKTTGEMARVFGKDMDDLYDKVRNITDPATVDNIQNGLVKVFSLGMMDSTPSQEAREALDSIDEGLTNLVKSGKADLAAAALERMQAAYGKGGKDVSEFTGQMDRYTAAVEDMKFEQELAAASMGVFGRAALDTKAKLDAQKTSADGLRQSIVALNDVNRAAGSAMSAFEQSLDDVSAAVKGNEKALSIRNGELDRGSQKARDAERVLMDLASNTDAAATAAREQGKSWEYVNGIYSRGQKAFIEAADAMGLNRDQAEALANTYLKIPDKKSMSVEMRTEDAVAGLDQVIAAIKATPDAKSVTVSTLNAEAIKALEAVGYKVTTLPDGSVTVSAATGTAITNIGAVQAARDNLSDKSITITVTRRTVLETLVTQPAASAADALRQQAENIRNKADGGIVDFYGNGGIRHFAGGSENHVAQIAPGGSWRVWGEPETFGEAYVPFARSKRVRSRAITEEVVRRLGGDPAGIQWNADGNVTDWRYDPQTGSLFSPSDAGAAGRKTKKVKGKDVDYFDLGAVERKLKSASRATQAWNKDLQAVADRVGGDVAEALASMGEEGVQLARKMAKGSTKYINDMAAALRGLQATARASLTDYTRQLTTANKVSADFADDLAKLAAMGYGDLAAQLAAQGDTAAQQLADAASRDKTKAAKANTAAKTANTALTADQMADLVQIIAAITTNKTGIHDVAAKTGLGEDVIIAVANKAKTQISKSLGNRATKFLADLGRANKHLSYADGGIRAGIYATRAGLIRFAEPETGGEAFLPLSASKRRTALPVLADVARRFGLGLTDAQAGRATVVVHKNEPTTVNVSTLRTGASASDIGFQVGRSVRRARRGGVNARAS
jgi:hypothetical protein